jgi:hypothetical protein
MAKSPPARFDLVGAGLGALIVAAMLSVLPAIYASTQPHRVASEQSAMD